MCERIRGTLPGRGNKTGWKAAVEETSPSLVHGQLDHRRCEGAGARVHWPLESVTQGSFPALRLGWGAGAQAERAPLCRKSGQETGAEPTVISRSVAPSRWSDGHPEKGLLPCGFCTKVMGSRGQEGPGGARSVSRQEQTHHAIARCQSGSLIKGQEEGMGACTRVCEMLTRPLPALPINCATMLPSWERGATTMPATEHAPSSGPCWGWQGTVTAGGAQMGQAGHEGPGGWVSAGQARTRRVR